MWRGGLRGFGRLKGIEKGIALEIFGFNFNFSRPRVK